MMTEPLASITYTNAKTGGALVENQVDKGRVSSLKDGLGRNWIATTARQFINTSDYDELNRPVTEWIVGPDKENAATSRTTYMDQTTEGYDPTLNQCGHPMSSLNQAGWGAPRGFGLNGHISGIETALSKLYIQPDNGMPAFDIPSLPDNAVKPVEMNLQNTSYTRTIQVDALTRPTETNDGTNHITNTGYDLFGSVNSINVDGNTYLQNIQYNAKGQLLSMTQGKFVQGTETGNFLNSFRYSNKDYRLQQAYVSTSASFINSLPPDETGWIDGSDDPGQLQDDKYIFDPAGNILETESSWPDVVFSQKGVTADNIYNYDARYRLLQANGWEGSTNSPISGLPAQKASEGAINFNDYASLTRFEQYYSYDIGENFTTLNHYLNGSSTPDKKRSTSMQISKGSNRSIATEWYNQMTGSDVTETGEIPESFFSDGTDPIFDKNGNQRKTPFLTNMQWNYEDQISSLSYIDPTNKTNTIYEYYVYLPGGGKRSHKVTKTINNNGLITHLSLTTYLETTEIRSRYKQSNPLVSIVYDGETISNAIAMKDYNQFNVRLGHTQSARILTGKLSETGLDDEVKVYFDLSNHITSIQMELDQSAQICNYQAYYPYGGTAFSATNKEEELSLKLKHYQYSDQEKDDSNLYYYGFRYYDPSSFRWTRPDPSGIRGSGLNWYNMTRNNPITHRDEHGLDLDGWTLVYGTFALIGVLLLYATHACLLNTRCYRKAWIKTLQCCCSRHAITSAPRKYTPSQGVHLYWITDNHDYVEQSKQLAVDLENNLNLNRIYLENYYREYMLDTNVTHNISNFRAYHNTPRKGQNTNTGGYFYELELPLQLAHKNKINIDNYLEPHTLQLFNNENSEEIYNDWHGKCCSIMCCKPHKKTKNRFMILAILDSFLKQQNNRSSYHIAAIVGHNHILHDESGVFWNSICGMEVGNVRYHPSILDFFMDERVRQEYEIATSLAKGTIVSKILMTQESLHGALNSSGIFWLKSSFRHFKIKGPYYLNERNKQALFYEIEMITDNKRNAGSKRLKKNPGLTQIKIK